MHWFVENLLWTIAGIAIGLSLKFFNALIAKYAESVVLNVDAAAASRRAFSDSAVRAAAARIDASRATEAIRLLTVLAFVSSKILEWQIFAYFRRRELENGQVLEDLGLDDVRQVQKKLVELTESVGSVGALLGTEVQAAVFDWSKSIYPVLFDLRIAYETSKEVNAGKPADSIDRFNTVKDLFEHKIAAKLDEPASAASRIRQLVNKHVGSDLGG
ncbi:hypothetical protein [Pseudoxanthomonas sp. LARHCG66]